MVIPFEVVDHQDLWFNVLYLFKGYAQTTQHMKKERNSKNRPNKIMYLPFFVFAIASISASFPDTLCTLFKLPSSRIH
jgi:hypothetical protein